MTKPVQECIFCGDPNLTQEHVFSKWMHKYFPPRPPGKGKVLRGLRHLDRDELKPVKVTRQLQDWQVRCVCGDRCNNGWMRREIEEKARPILIPLMQGESVRLSPAQQHILASWIALKCMISEYDVGSYVTTRSWQRKRMMKIQKPPTSGWGIWIGSCSRQSLLPQWFSMAFSVLNNPKPGLNLNEERPTRFNSHSSTQVINKFFVQVIRLPTRNFITKWQFNLPDRGVLIRIWPPGDTTSHGRPENFLKEKPISRLRRWKISL